MTPSNTPSTSAARILLVEDEFLVATMLEQDLRDAGFSVVGPFLNLDAAADAAAREAFDLALLDVNLNGRMIYPLAGDLIARGVPFIFLSGYSLENTPAEFKSVPRVAKPYHLPVLLREIRGLVPQMGTQ